MSRSVLCVISVVCLLGARAWAGEDACADEFNECRDDCTISWGGSVQVDNKKRFDRCMKVCVKNVNRCSEHAVETRTNQLDEGALDRAPSSAESDADNADLRASNTKKKKKKNRTVETAAASEEVPSRPRETLRDDEVPRSNRTRLKSEDDQANKKEPGHEESRIVVEQPPPKRSETQRTEGTGAADQPSKKRSRPDDDLRDDRKAVEPERTARPVDDSLDRKRPADNAPRSEKPQDDTARERPKKREEPPPERKSRLDEDDLRNF